MRWDWGGLDWMLIHWADGVFIINHSPSPNPKQTHAQGFYIQPAADKAAMDGMMPPKAPAPPESGNERKVLPPRQDSLAKLKKAADKASRKGQRLCGGENAPFATMMVLTSVYMVTELAMSLITGCVSVSVCGLVDIVCVCVYGAVCVLLIVCGERGCDHPPH